MTKQLQARVTPRVYLHGHWSASSPNVDVLLNEQSALVEHSTKTLVRIVEGVQRARVDIPTRLSQRTVAFRPVEKSMK